MTVVSGTWSSNSELSITARVWHVQAPCAFDVNRGKSKSAVAVCSPYILIASSLGKLQSMELASQLTNNLQVSLLIEVPISSDWPSVYIAIPSAQYGSGTSLPLLYSAV